MADLVMPSSPTSEDDELEQHSGLSGRRIHPYSEELRSMWNWWKIFFLLGTHEQCVQFAEERGLIPRGKQGIYHHKAMTFTAEAGQLGKFRCRKSNCRTKSISCAAST